MAFERLEMEIVGKNSTAKGWDKVETEAKRRAKKIRDAIARDGGLVGNASGGHGGGMLANIRHGFESGKHEGIGGLLPGGGLMGLGGVALGAAAIGGVVAGITKLAHVAMEYSQSVVMMQENTGVSLQSAQNLVYAGKKYDVSAEMIETALGRIAKAQSMAGRDEGVQKSLERLNIPLKEFMNMSPDEAYIRLGKALKETGDRADVMAIVGKGGLKQMGFLRDMADGIKDVGLASDQNIEAVHGFEIAISRLWMRMKAGTTNKIGQALRGDLNGFFGGKEVELGPSSRDQIEQQNDRIRKERETDEAVARVKEIKDLKAKIEGGDVTRALDPSLPGGQQVTSYQEGAKDRAERLKDQIQEKQDEVDAVEKELNEKKSRGHWERNARAWAGLQDMTAEQHAADDLKRGFNRGYDKQQSHSEREAKRMERRMKMREEMLQNHNIKGPWADKIRKTLEKAHKMADKRDFVEDYNKVIAEMSKQQRDLLRDIEKDTKALQKLEKAMTMGGINEGEGG